MWRPGKSAGGEYGYFKSVSMGEKKSFALRIDADTMKAIEKWAADEFRSVNGQIEWMLHQSLTQARRLKEKKEKDKDRTDP